MAVYTTINDPEAYFQVKAYTGDGASTLALTLDGDTNMQPDLVWIKNRSSTENHALVDSVRGVGKQLLSNGATAEYSNANSVKAFNSDGFSVGDLSDTNGSGNSLVAWCWKAATYGATYYSKVESGTQSNNDTASSIGITSGTISGSEWRVAVNRDSGFSIVRYDGNETAGATVGHGLNATPQTIIVKNRNNTEEWVVYHHKNTAAPATDHLHLNGSDATADLNTVWNDTAPTSTVFSVGSGDIANKNGEDLIAYLWSEKQGFSKFGSYTGNGQAGISSPFVYTGFRPAWLMIKNTADTHSWSITDNRRSGYNENATFLYADTTGTDAAYPMTSFYSNGFQPIEAGADKGAVNQSGNVYVYWAFAEAPFVNSNGVPANAR